METSKIKRAALLYRKMQANEYSKGTLASSFYSPRQATREDREWILRHQIITNTTKYPPPQTNYKRKKHTPLKRPGSQHLNQVTALSALSHPDTMHLRGCREQTPFAGGRGCGQNCGRPIPQESNHGTIRTNPDGGSLPKTTSLTLQENQCPHQQNCRGLW